MSLPYDKYPGEWHGPGSISLVIRDLNKLYQPYVDLKIAHFSDGFVYFEKVKRLACQTPLEWLHKVPKRPKSE